MPGGDRFELIAVRRRHQIDAPVIAIPARPSPFPRRSLYPSFASDRIEELFNIG
jgi:hypothetical protein